MEIVNTQHVLTIFLWESQLISTIHKKLNMLVKLVTMKSLRRVCVCVCVCVCWELHEKTCYN